MNAAIKQKREGNAEPPHRREPLRRVIPLEEPTPTPNVEDLWGRNWYVLYVEPGREWMARSGLLDEQFDGAFAVYLPVLTRWSNARFRIKKAIERPLLARYLFVGLTRVPTDADLSDILNVEGVQAVLGRKEMGRPWRVPTENLVQLVGEQVEGVYDATRRPVFEEGEAVLVEGGPFAGHDGVISRTVAGSAALDRPVEVLMRMFGSDEAVVPVEIALADLGRPLADPRSRE